MNLKFSTENRIRKKEEFETIYTKGKRINCKYFFCFILDNNLKHPRLGLTVSKVIGNSVTRNRAKRLLREMFRLNKHLFKKPVDIIINAKKNIVKANLKELVTTYLKTLKKLGLINNE